jgi:putative membrane protein
LSGSPVQPDEPVRPPAALLGLRGGIGGALMGLANLVPGISGGTMLVATGVYTQFITAIAEISALRFRPRSVLLLGAVIGSALIAIGLLAGLMVRLVWDWPMVMFSLFIGLTLGGVPLIVRMIGRMTPGAWTAATIAFALMALLAYVQAFGAGVSVDREGFVFMMIAGLVAAGAMILPGVSGGYMLLVLGVYVPVLSGVRDFAEALPLVGRFDAAGLGQVGLAIILPVGIGVLVGIVGVSNALKWLLHRFEKATLGALLGLLVGAVVGLWPFQQMVTLEQISTIKGQAVTLVDERLVYTKTGAAVEVHDYPRHPRAPRGLTEAAQSLGLVLAGFGATAVLARVGRERAGRG